MNDDALIDLFKEIAQMPPTNWFVAIEYLPRSHPLDEAFEDDLRTMADERGGRFAQASIYSEPEPKARNVSYMFPSEEVAHEYSKAVKEKHLFGTDRVLYATVYSDTEAPPMQRTVK